VVRHELATDKEGRVVRRDGVREVELDGLLVTGLLADKVGGGDLGIADEAVLAEDVVVVNRHLDLVVAFALAHEEQDLVVPLGVERVLDDAALERVHTKGHDKEGVAVERKEFVAVVGQAVCFDDCFSYA